MPRKEEKHIHLHFRGNICCFPVRTGAISAELEEIFASFSFLKLPAFLYVVFSRRWRSRIFFFLSFRFVISIILGKYRGSGDAVVNSVSLQ